MAEVIGGTVYLVVDGEQFACVGNFTYNLGRPMREPKIGADGFHGLVETHQSARIEGEISDLGGLDIERLQSLTDATASLEIPNGKTVVVRNGGYTAAGDVTTEQGNVQFKFEGPSGDIIQ